MLGDIYYSNHYKNVVTSFAGEIRDRGVGVTSDHVFILGVDKVDFLKIPHVCQGCWTTVFVIYKGGFNNGRYMIKSENTGAKTGYFDCHGPPKPTVERSCIIGDSGEVTGFTGLISQIDIYKGTDLLSIPNALRDLLFFDHRPKDYTLYDGNLDKLRMNEQCSYFFSSKGDFILNHTGVIAGLKSQSIIRNRDAMERAALWGSLKIEKIPGTEFLAVRIVGNTLEVENVNIAKGKLNSYTCVAITFKLYNEIPREDAFLISNSDNTRAIGIDSDFNIFVLGDDSKIPVWTGKMNLRGYNTLFVLWSNIDNMDYSYVYYNNRKTKFETKINRAESIEETLYICGTSDHKRDRNFKGYISALDVYTAIEPIETFPEVLMEKLLEDHYTRR